RYAISHIRHINLTRAATDVTASCNEQGCRKNNRDYEKLLHHDLLKNKLPMPPAPLLSSQTFWFPCRICRATTSFLFCPLLHPLHPPFQGKQLLPLHLSFLCIRDPY